MEIIYSHAAVLEVGLVVEVQLARVAWPVGLTEQGELGMITIKRMHILESSALVASLAVLGEVAVTADAMAVRDVGQGRLAAMLPVTTGTGGRLRDQRVVGRTVVALDAGGVADGVKGGVAGQAIDINDRGEIVGAYQLNDYWTGEQRSFIWRNGVISDLLRLSAGSSSGAWGINNRGQVVGQAFGTVDGRTIAGAYLWTNGTIHLLGGLGGQDDRRRAPCAVRAATSRSGGPAREERKRTGGVYVTRQAPPGVC